MRPSDITDGNLGHDLVHVRVDDHASMRPSDITDGNLEDALGLMVDERRFNEAVGYYRRKHTILCHPAL